MGMLKKASDLFRLWEESDVVYCHWKSNEHLLKGLEGKTDLDVLVAEKSNIGACAVLRDLGYKKVASQFGGRYYKIEDWIGHDEDSGTQLHIHLHFRMATGHKGLKEFSFPWDEDVLRLRIKDDRYGVYVCPPDYEIVLLYVRIGLKSTITKLIAAIFGKYVLPKDEKQEILYLKNLADFERVSVIVQEYFEDDTDRLLDIIKKDGVDSKDYLLLSRICRKRLRGFRNCNGLCYVFQRIRFAILIPINSGLKKIFRVNFATKKTLGEGKGITIAFIGQDGSGKSTVTNDIREWLSWKLDVHKVYLGSGDHYLSWQKRIYRFIPHSSRGLLRMIRGVLIVEDYKKLSKRVYRNIKKATRLRERGSIIIFDRYPQMQYCGINDGPTIGIKCEQFERIPIIGRYIKYCANVEERYLKKSLEEPLDLVFKMILDPEESIKRKPSENIDIIKKKHEIIKNLKFENSKVIVINADIDYEKELQYIKYEIWKNILKISGGGDELNCKCRLTNALNNEVCWLIWKGAYHYEDGFNGRGDIDILVSKFDTDKTRTILRKLGFVYVETQRYLRRENVEDWIGFEKKSGTLIHVHLHFTIPFGLKYVLEYEFAMIELCLKNRVKMDDGVYIQAPFMELILVLCMVEKHCISLNKTLRYREYFANNIETIVQSNILGINNSRNDLIVSELVRFINDGQYDSKSELGNLIRKLCVRKKNGSRFRFMYRCFWIGVCKVYNQMIDK